MKVSQKQKCETTHICGLFPLNFYYALKTLTRLKANKMKPHLRVHVLSHCNAMWYLLYLFSLHYLNSPSCHLLFQGNWQQKAKHSHSKLCRQFGIQPENQVHKRGINLKLETTLKASVRRITPNNGGIQTQICVNKWF